jgi:hypothetical protein
MVWGQTVLAPSSFHQQLRFRESLAGLKKTAWRGAVIILKTRHVKLPICNGVGEAGYYRL